MTNEIANKRLRHLAFEVNVIQRRYEQGKISDQHRTQRLNELRKKFDIFHTIDLWANSEEEEAETSNEE